MPISLEAALVQALAPHDSLIFASVGADTEGG
jgi:hypothetical protein